MKAQQLVFVGKSIKQISKEKPRPEAPRRPIIVPKLVEEELLALIDKAHRRMDEVKGGDDASPNAVYR